MRSQLAAEPEPRAARSKVEMGARGLPWNRLAESVKRNVMVDQVLAQPDAFGLIRVYGDVHAPAVIEAQRPVHRGFALGADRKNLPELHSESPLDFAERG